MDKAESKPLLFSNRALIGILIPLILDGLLAILAGVVDSIMVSSSGESAVSAISLVDQINIMFITLLSNCAAGGSVVTSQYLGSNNAGGARNSAAHLIFSGAALGLVLSVLLLCLAPWLLQTVYSGIEPIVYQYAKTYFYITALQLPFLAVGSACTNLLRTMGKGTTALFLFGGSNVLNIIGNAIFIYGFHLGVAGAALSTTLCRVIWCICGIVLLHQKGMPVHFDNLLHIKLDFSMVRRVLRIGVSNGVENMLFQLGKLLIASLVATFGTIAIAANSVSNTLNNIGYVILGAFATTVLTVVGRCIGAGEQEQARYYTRKLIFYEHIMSAVLFGLIFLFRYPLVQLFQFSPEALEAAAYYTGIGALFSFATIYPWAYAYTAAFRAAGDIKYTMVLSVATMFIFRVGLSYLLEHLFSLGLLSIWIGTWADSFCRSMVNKFHYHRSNWIKKKLI